MKSLTMMIVIAASGALLAGTPGYAQEKPAAQPPVGAKPSAPAPAGQTPAAPPVAAPAAPQPPKPFPEGAKVAFVSYEALLNASAEGKAAGARFDDWMKKKNTELQGKQTQLKTLQDKLDSSVLNDATRAQLAKDVERGQRDFTFAQQDAQKERDEMLQQLRADLQQKVQPILEQVRVEKGLLMIFSINDAGVVAADLGLDLTEEVMKRFDAASKTAPAPKK